MICFLLMATLAAAQRNDIQPKCCGPYSIPYEMVVDLAGSPELHCDSPPCIGKPTVTPTSSNLDFWYIRHRRLHFKDSFNEKEAKCTGIFTKSVCMANNEWTGGVMEHNNGTHIFLQMQCCRFNGLNYGTPLKTVMLQAGDRYRGGRIYRNGKLIAFDLIKEIRKKVTKYNEIIYVLSVYRMSCNPDIEDRRSSCYNSV